MLVPYLRELPFPEDSSFISEVEVVQMNAQIKAVRYFLVSVLFLNVDGSSWLILYNPLHLSHHTY